MEEIMETMRKRARVEAVASVDADGYESEDLPDTDEGEIFDVDSENPYPTLEATLDATSRGDATKMRDALEFLVLRECSDHAAKFSVFPICPWNVPLPGPEDMLNRVRRDPAGTFRDFPLYSALFEIEKRNPTTLREYFRIFAQKRDAMPPTSLAILVSLIQLFPREPMLLSLALLLCNQKPRLAAYDVDGMIENTVLPFVRTFEPTEVMSALFDNEPLFAVHAIHHNLLYVRIITQCLECPFCAPLSLRVAKNIVVWIATGATSILTQPPMIACLVAKRMLPAHLRARTSPLCSDLYDYIEQWRKHRGMALRVEHQRNIYVWMAHFVDFTDVAPTEFPATIPFLSSPTANQIFRYRKMGFVTETEPLVAVLFAASARNERSALNQLPVYVLQDVAKALRSLNKEMIWTPSGRIWKGTGGLSVD